MLITVNNYQQCVYKLRSQYIIIKLNYNYTFKKSLIYNGKHTSAIDISK